MKLKIQSEDMHGDKYNQTFNAQIEEGTKGKKISYKDENGFVTIYLYEGKMRIARSGHINSKQIFDVNNEYNFRYTTIYLESHLTLKTNELIIDSNNVNLEYELYSDRMLVNKIKMSINVE